MNVVALYNLPEDREPFGTLFADALGKTLYEANARLRVPGPGPVVVAVLNEPETARTLKAKLEASGLNAITVDDEEVRPIRSRLLVKKLSFEDEGVRVETSEGKTIEVPYSSARMLLHAMGSQRTTTTEQIKETKIGIGKAVMTGGLSIRKTTERTVENVEDIREPFVLLLAPGNPVLEFREAALDYAFLGPERQPSRAANFNTFVTMLRQHCPSAAYDNRLLQKSEQTKLLGPVLSTETHLDTALTLLAKVLWSGNAKG